MRKDKTHILTTASITDFGAIYKLFKILLLRAGKVNVPCVNLTLDAGAYVNAYRVLCNYPDKISKVVLHLGDFRFMKEVFTMLGTLVKGSEFEDVIFQAGVCSTGSLNGVLSGSHYNRYWTVHSVMREALERLCMELFLKNENVLPNEVRMCCEDIPMSSEFLAEGDAVTTFIEKYEEFKADIHNGKYGKTAKFWVVYYMDVLLLCNNNTWMYCYYSNPPCSTN